MTEEWRPIHGYEDSHEASSAGRIRNIRTGNILSPSIQKDSGRAQVSIWRDGIGTVKRVHSLVALAFYGPRPHGMEVRHLNGDQLDNRVVNLKYGTHSENELDKRSHGTHFHGSKTHCKNGHAFIAENVYINPGSGQRVCRTCSRRMKAAYKLRKKLETANGKA